ncbi:MAG: hypothetical protein KKD17_02070 [Nanoarchaeota archaeon]|nr:hypothetical protein [Nanoarchaeota archaeon]
MDIAQYIEGILKIANLFLAITAGAIGLTLIRRSLRDAEMRAWKYLAAILILFAFQQLLGFLRAFGIYTSPFLTHVNVSLILLLLIYTLNIQLKVVK